MCEREQFPKAPDDSNETGPGRVGLWLDTEPGDEEGGGAAETTSPVDQQESSFVEDVDRAWDMAHAVKPIRDDIAEVRASGKGHAERFVRTGDTTSRKLAEQTIGLVNKLDRKANKVEDKVGRRYDKGQDLLRELGVRSSEES